MCTSDLDKAIQEYHSVEEQKTEYLFSRYFSEDKIPTVDEPTKDPNKLWSVGLSRWGKEWSEREYQLRNEREAKTQTPS